MNREVFIAIGWVLPFVVLACVGVVLFVRANRPGVNAMDKSFGETIAFLVLLGAVASGITSWTYMTDGLYPAKPEVRR